MNTFLVLCVTSTSTEWGDRTEPHIINASMRLMMAFCTAKNEEVMDTLGLSYEKEVKRDEADT